MERLWAPWRNKYIASVDKEKKGCVFCGSIKEKKDKENLILQRTECSFVIMNRYPYNNGHLLVVPNRHIDDIVKLDKMEYLDLWDTVLLCKKVLNDVFNPHGFNIGMNIGKSAGAGITDHCHVHILPRWSGDTNYMPLIANVKVISESLNDTYKKLKDMFNEKC